MTERDWLIFTSSRIDRERANKTYYIHVSATVTMHNEFKHCAGYLMMTSHLAYLMS